MIPGERFVLAGHSAGAYLARAILHRRATSIDGLLQVVPVVGIDDADDPVPLAVTLVRDDGLIDEIGAELGPDVAAAFSRSIVVQRRDIYEAFKRLLPGMAAPGSPFLASLDQAVSFSVDPLPDPFPGPTLFVLGRQDSVVGYATALGLVDDYPRATFAGARCGRATPCPGSRSTCSGRSPVIGSTGSKPRSLSRLPVRSPGSAERDPPSAAPSAVGALDDHLERWRPDGLERQGPAASRSISSSGASSDSVIVRCGMTTSKAPSYGGWSGNRAATAAVSPANGSAGSGAR